MDPMEYLGSIISSSRAPVKISGENWWIRFAFKTVELQLATQISERATDCASSSMEKTCVWVQQAGDWGGRNGVSAPRLAIEDRADGGD